MNKFDMTLPILSFEDALRRGTNAFYKVAFAIALLCMMAPWSTVSIVQAQVSTAPFLEFEGLVVMEAESVPRSSNWQFENTEEGFGGDGYLRYVGENHFSDPGNDILEFQVVITNPGRYRMFTFISHKGAPQPDQENDVWTKMNDGEWFKTVHGGLHIDEGFSHHTNWVVFDENGEETFPEPEYELEAGIHTFLVSGRSFNVRLDRIHIWKDDDPFRVFYSEAAENTLPESERSTKILTVDPDPIAFSATPVGGSSAFTVDLVNGGDEILNVTDVSLSGTDAAQFKEGFSGSSQIAANGTLPLELSFEPTTTGSKIAQIVVTHDGINSPTIVNLFGSATSGGSGSTVLFRVNAGGPAIEDALADWEEDQVTNAGNAVNDAENGTPNSKVNALPTGDWSWGQNDVITLDASVPPGTPTELFQVGRWDPPANPLMQWDIPVEAGKEIEVRLYFTEIRFTSAEDPDGPRLFSVLIDNLEYSGMSDINLFEEYGHDVGAMKSAVIISDGNVDIDFVNNSNDPMIMGIEIIELGSLSRNMDTGWNLVGVPTSPANTDYTSVFNNLALTTAPFIYDNGAYAQATDVEAGVGYWINISAEGNQSFSDETVNALTLNLNAGWNLISGPGCFMPLSNVSDPGNILVAGSLFSYDGNYQQGSALLPGFGYWVQTTSAGSITLDCGVSGKGASGAGDDINLERFGAIEVRDSGEGAQTLYFGSQLDQDQSILSFKLPPQAPRGIFDARFSNNGRLNEGSEGYIVIRSEYYPVALELIKTPQFISSQVTIEEITSAGAGRTYQVSEGDIITISNPEVTAVKIATGEPEEEIIPSRFALQGNYPNPFNPTTQLVFDLPEAAVIQVEIFDMLGRKVMSIPAMELSAGANQKVQIDANDLASGMYLYNVQAQMGSKTEFSTGRMTLLK